MTTKQATAKKPRTRKSKKEAPEAPSVEAVTQSGMTEADVKAEHEAEQKFDPERWVIRVGTVDHPFRLIPESKEKGIEEFWMGETVVTQELWEAVMGTNPSRYQNDPRNPVEQVSWYDCLEFCNRLSIMRGLKPCYYFREGSDGTEIVWDEEADGFRLPCEAEWEHAARANTDYEYAGSNDPNEVAWFWENSGEGMPGGERQTHPVAQKKPNDWGLFDMSGNVWEWQWDPYSPEEKEAEKTRGAELKAQLDAGQIPPLL